MYSMTGFACAERQIRDYRLTWELRAVNHRYLDIQLRLPDTFRKMEREFRTRATRLLSRGKFEATLRCQIAADSETRIELDREKLENLRMAVAALGNAMDVAPLDPLAVLGWPGVIRQQVLDSEPLAEAAETLFDEALNDLAQARAREGMELKALIRQRLDGLEELVSQVQNHFPESRRAWVERLRSRCQQLSADLDESRLAQETAILAQKMDVDEEMSRLRVHIGEMRDVLERLEPVGRRLDFLLQELNREANTLASKSQDEQMTASAVEMKVLIEQIREQVQNVE